MATRREGATGRFVRTTGWAWGGGSARLGTGGHKRWLLRELGTGQTPCHGHRGAQPIVSLLWVPFYPARGARLSRAALGGQQAPAPSCTRVSVPGCGVRSPSSPSPRLEHQRATRRDQEPSQGMRVCRWKPQPTRFAAGNRLPRASTPNPPRHHPWKNHPLGPPL